MEIMTQEKTKDLKLYKFNEEMFELLKGNDYNALKDDIKRNGVKVELHILPDKTVICGHQRLRIAKELKIEHLRCKTVYGLDTPEQVKEYVILDNLLRRHLSKEKRAYLNAELVKMKFKPQLKDEEGKFKPFTQNESTDVYKEVAKETGVSKATVQRDVAYVEEITEFPELKKEKQSVVLKHRKKRKEGADGKKVVLVTMKELDLRFGDFKKVLSDIPDASIDLILTDPPYGCDYLYLWDELGVLAKRVLKKNGFCICYSGEMFLPDVFAIMGKHLDYYWTTCLLLTGKPQVVTPRNVYCNWKPILIYQNGFKKKEDRFSDIIKGSGRSKKNHDWEQSVGELMEIIKNFSPDDGIILDPMCGSGTTLIMTRKLKRKAIGVEIDEDYYNIAKKRLKDELEL